ncbi:MAG: acyltransferase [Gammaproteobacteria bacterium]|nr:acyltransferase [Gammaproteobacteria bacterium]
MTSSISGIASTPGNSGLAANQLPPVSAATAERLQIARTLCIFFMVFAHSFPMLLTPDGVTAAALGNTARIVSAILYDGLARVSMPLLSILSGYLALQSYGRRGYRGVLTEKLRTLLVPLIAWSALSIMFDLGYGAASGGLADIVARLPTDALGWVNALVGLTDKPWNFPLYFLRDLFLCFLLLPVFLFLLKLSRSGTLLLVVVLCAGTTTLFGLVDGGILPIFQRQTIPVLFVLGLAIRMGPLPMPSLNVESWRGPATIVALALLIALTMSRATVEAAAWGFFFEPLRLTLGIGVAWCVISLVAGSAVGAAMLRLARFVFLVFCSHEIVLSLLGIGLRAVFDWSVPTSVRLVATLLAPLLCFALAALVQPRLEDWLPRLTVILLGSRHRGGLPA